MNKNKLDKTYHKLLKDSEDYFKKLCNKLQKQYGNAFLLKIEKPTIFLWYYDLDDNCYDSYRVINIDVFGNILLLNDTTQQEMDTLIESHNLQNKLRLIDLIQKHLKYGKH